MATLAEITDGIQTTLGSISGLRVYDNVPDMGLNFPAAFIVPTNIEFDLAMQRGTDMYTFDVMIAVQRADSRTGQDILHGYITGSGSNSIRQAIFTNRTLGLDDTDARVSTVSNISADVSVNGIDAIGANIEVEVYTKGTS